MLYNYKVIDKFGNVLNNTLEADNKNDAIRKLRNSGFIVSKININFSDYLRSSLLKFLPDKVAIIELERKDRISFYHELLSLRKNGLKELYALEHVKDNEILSKKIRTLASLMFYDMEKGESFYEVAKKRGIPEEHAEIIKTGSYTGRGIETLEALLRKEKLEEKLSKGIISIITYPLIMIIIITMATILCAFYITPLNKRAMDSILSSMGKVDYPPFTKAAFYISEHILLFVVGPISFCVGAFIIIYLLSKKYPKVKYFFSYIYSKIPFFGTFTMYKEYASLTSLLSLTLGSGFKSEQAITFCHKQIGNEVLNYKFGMVIKLVSTGAYTVSQAMDITNFNKTITTVIKRGETLGRKEVSENLAQISNSFSDSALYNLTLIEKSSEFLNMIILYIFAIPILLITLAPQMEQMVLMTGMM